ncbi:MAG: YicC/YloC family endoribonuclease [Moraxellaceae bacterium]|nr:YicC/YloC family endoribonuclease [Moraxellaceae bacterium]
MTVNQPVVSMTAFARSEISTAAGQLSLEIRSVNSRHLELSFRLPELLREREFAWRDLVRSRLARGKVEVNLRFSAAENSEMNALVLNQPLLAQLIERMKEVDRLIPHIAPASSLDILRMPGVLVSEEADHSALITQADALLSQALDDFTAMRAREGAALNELIMQRLTQVEAEVTSVRERLPQIMTSFQQRLRARFDELSINPERLEQELVLFAQKMDVAEELDRLLTHVAEIRRVLNQGGAVGRRLDFLMQELNREANTLGSKAVTAESSWSSVELKVLVEQMREQIQNIE